MKMCYTVAYRGQTFYWSSSIVCVNCMKAERNAVVRVTPQLTVPRRNSYLHLYAMFIQCHTCIIMILYVLGKCMFLWFVVSGVCARACVYVCVCVCVCSFMGVYFSVSTLHCNTESSSSLRPELDSSVIKALIYSWSPLFHSKTCLMRPLHILQLWSYGQVAA